MKISVIIPALNEGEIIARTLEDLFQNHAPDEVIVCDGGSTDDTVSVAAQFCRVLGCGRGRAKQMNAGAKAASGDILIFLHADTRLPPGAIDEVKRVIAGGEAGAGRFHMRFDDEDQWLKIYAAYTRFHFFSYGDQAFFVTRGIFERLGGFCESAPFEDIDFYKRLRKATKPRIIPSPVTTSARRFLKVGKFRQKWINLFLVALYYMNVDVLSYKAKMYRDVR